MAVRPLRTAHRHAACGFTLMELLIVLSIIAILATVAVPSYRASVVSGKRQDAHIALYELLGAQERLRANCNRYATTLGGADDCQGRTVAFGAESAQAQYALSIVEAGPHGFIARASAKAGTSQAGDTGCSVLTLELDRGAVRTTPEQCWRKG